ncbi:MAG: T9SS type A sorting domain-containing protein, partial [Ignavibacteriales bacterium]|nr:T9SS type A sorting domain-containing protein [Ignavibacteriales bacterium]
GSRFPNNAALVKGLVDSMKAMFANFHPFTVISGHSGGGSFAFDYLNSASVIPDDVKRIEFLDSDYNYTDTYGSKLRAWINAAPDHFLSVLAYNDSIALLNGQPFVSATGGTWYRTRMMIAYLSNYFSFTADINEDFITCTALNGRIKIILKQNPTRAVLHTVQVELNGFVQTMLSGTPLEGVGYVYYGPRVYSDFVQTWKPVPKPVQFPPRPPGSPTGSQFMTSVAPMTFDQREAEIYKQISLGNVPDFLRGFKKIQSSFQDANGVSHTVIYEVTPDYLCIGSDEDFCRIPMGPITAQKLANLFGATMPTPKLVDNIHLNADVKLAPVTYTPVGNQNELVSKFVDHNTAIEAQRVAAGRPLGALIDGIKKDVVLSNRIADPANANRVVIYGWYRLDGTAIQPVYSNHINSYVDYSHGIRFINKEMLVDSVVMTASQVLTNSTLYKVLSNESGVMPQPSYFKNNAIPSVPKSFGIKSESGSALRIIMKPDSTATGYVILVSRNGVTFVDSVTTTPDNLVLTNLLKDSLYCVKIEAFNQIGISSSSELLAGLPSATQPQVLVVNGYDRASAGNTHDFIRQHASSFIANRVPLSSATNDAIVDGLFSLVDYAVVDYILGDESFADESFSSAEQVKVKAFLQNGGKLFVSGSELAWDLGYKGTASDKDFLNNYLKVKYIDDAPNGSSSTTYQAEGISGTLFGGVPSVPFDNGTQGTIDVQWPDVISPISGAVGCMKYVSLDTSSGFSGVSYQGYYPSGVRPGMSIVLGFPFETIYPQNLRTQVLGRILSYFGTISAVDPGESTPKRFALYQNYPNPFNPTTTIRYDLPSDSFVVIRIFNALGQCVDKVVDARLSAGQHSVNWNASHIPSGIYFYRLEANNRLETKKMLVLK